MNAIAGLAIDSQGRIFLRYKHAPGGLWVDMSKPDPNQQVYSHKDDKGVWRHWDVFRLQCMIDSSAFEFNPIVVEIEPATYQHVLVNCGIEQSGLARIDAVKLSKPGISVLFPDGSSIIVDGNHRLVKRCQNGLPWMKFDQLTEEVAKIAMLDLDDEFAEHVVRLPHST